MLSRKKQLAINLMITTLFMTASVGVYASNSGGVFDATGNYWGDNGANNNDVKIDSPVTGNVYCGYENGSSEVGRNKVTITNGIIDGNVYGGYSDYVKVVDNSVNINGGEIGRDVYGAISANGDVAENSVTINNGEIDRNVYGGYNDGSGKVTGNRVTVSGATIGGDINGGHSESGNAEENIVIITGGRISKEVYGAYSTTGNAEKNRVTITGGTIGNSGATMIYGGKSGSGNAEKNIVTITNGKVSGNIYGGFSDSGRAVSNIVEISGGEIGENVYGGHSNGRDVAENIVTITDGKISGNVYGGHSSTGANRNGVTISGGEISGIVYGGRSTSGQVTENRVEINGGIIGKYVYGAISASGNVAKNSVTITNGKIGNGAVVSNVYGGFSTNGQAIDNKVTISGGEISGIVHGGSSISNNVIENSVEISGGKIGKDVYGGQSDFNTGGGSANSNSVIVSGGEISGNIYGGNSHAGANSNNVEISGGEIGRDVYGGYSYVGANRNSVDISAGKIGGDVYGGHSYIGKVDGNKVTISGGEIAGNICGGNSSSNDAINNTVTIKGNPTFGSGTILHGGFSSTGSNTDVLTGNKLEVYRHTTNANGTHAVKGVENFAKMNFYLGNTTKNGDIMLQVADEVKLDKTDVGVDIATGEKLNLVAGDKVTLINSAIGVNTPKSKTIYGGLEKIYGLDFFKEDKALGVAINKAEKNTKVEAIPVAQMTGQSMLRIGGDTVAMQGMTSALVATKMERVENPNEGEGGMPNLSTEKSFLNKGAVFATIGGGTSKYKAGGTSDVNSFNIVTGMAWRINQPKNNNLILGAFFESGWGNYTTHNSYADGNVRGDGSSDYLGGGILGRYEFSCGTYVEGSVRMGRVKNDYHSNDLRGAGDGRVGYNTSDNYTGAHLGLGYIKKINDQTELDFYGKYLYTHQGGSSVTMVGDNISFDPTNSHRLRLGARLAQKTTKDFNGYVGLAYEYEFDGKMGSSINYNPILAPSVKGSSGILELGVIFKPTNNKNLSIDLSVNCYAGKREGVSGNLQFKYLF